MKNMTEGSPSKALLYFAIPMVLGNLFQQFYNIVDSLIVGNYVGSNALAAVGASSSITFLFIAIATGACTGASVVISRFFGANKYEEVKKSITTIIIAILVLSLVFTCIGVLGSNVFLRLMNTPDNIYKDALDYLRIYFLGITFLFLYNAFTAIFNAMGDSKIPLALLILSSVLNIILDFIFVLKLGMGVKGVALGTLIAQGISALLSFLCLSVRLRKLKTEKAIYGFDWGILKSISYVAIPSALQQSIVSIGMILVQTLVNGYGEFVVAGYTVGTKIDNIAMVPILSVSNALSTYTAQNIGAKKLKRVDQGIKVGWIITLTIAIVTAILVFLFGNQIVGAFIDKNSDPSIIKVGVEYLRIVSVFYFVMGLMKIYTGILRGASDMLVFTVSTLANLVVRVGLAYMGSYWIGEKAIWWSIPIGWFVGFIIPYIRYKSGKWIGKQKE